MVAVCTNFGVVLISRDKEKVKDWERGFCSINEVYFLGEKKNTANSTKSNYFNARYTDIC